MLNKYPLWKYLLVLFVLTLGFFYAAPNLYAPDPALQVAGESSAQVIDDRTLGRALASLDKAGIEHFGERIDLQREDLSHGQGTSARFVLTKQE